MESQSFRFGRKNRPLGKDQNAKIYLTFGPKCSIIRVSGWQAYDALPLGNVLASHVVGDKRLIPDIP